jgi:hypothetical protein
VPNSIEPVPFLSGILANRGFERTQLSDKPASVNADEVALSRRRRVGWSSVVLLILAAVGFWFEGQESIWASACMRVGVVLFTLWLCLPAGKARFGWNSLSGHRLAVIILVAAFILFPASQRRFILPILAVYGLIVWASQSKSTK